MFDAGAQVFECRKMDLKEKNIAEIIAKVIEEGRRKMLSLYLILCGSSVESNTNCNHFFVLKTLALTLQEEL